MKEGTTFTLAISKVYEALFDGDALSVTIPSTEGELTILAQHEPLITKLKQGTITVRTPHGEEKFLIEKGVLETSNGQVTILV